MLADTDQKFALSPELTKQINELETEWASAKQKGIIADRDERRRVYDEMREDAFKVITRVGNDAKLMLDTDLGIFSTVEMVLVFIPENELRVADALEIGQEILERKSMTPEENQALIGDLALLKADTEKLKEALEVVHQHETTADHVGDSLISLKSIEGQFESFFAADSAFLEMVERRLINKTTTDLEEEEFVRAGTKALDEGARLADAIEPILEAALQTRINSLNLARYLETGLVLFVVLLAVVLAYFIVRSVTRPLNEAVGVAKQLAQGDLSAIVVATSTDETGQMLHAINEMTDYLREMAVIAENVSVGDLSLRVSPRSDEDSFGVAFQNMQNYLEGMATVSDEIASGNLDVKIEPKSEDDRFGTSFKNMFDSTLSLIQSRNERDELQKNIVKLLDEIGDVANGDLTVEAEVTADSTGAIADSFNFMIEQLRGVINNVKDATLHVSSSATEIQATTEHLAQGSEEQSIQLSDTSSAIEEMAVSIQQVSDNAAESATVANTARDNAKQGAQAVQNNITAMGRIRDQVQETAKRIKRLGERSQEIGEIIQLIDDIADRTSMLALNASIQAAMAGEAGRGFAVVAEEVERLSDRSTNATKQIGALIKSIQSETNEAVAAMEETTREVVEGSKLANDAGQSLTEIESVSNHLAEIIQAISQASKQQARGSEELAKSMTGISNVTQQVAAGSKQAAVSVRSLAALSDTLRNSVATFKLPGTNGNGGGNGHTNGSSYVVNNHASLN